MEIEKGFLANLIVNGREEAKKVQGLVNETDFVFEPHQIIFQAIMEFVKKEKDYDATLLINYLKIQEGNLVNYSHLIKNLITDWYIGTSLQKHYIAKFYERRTLRKISSLLAEFSVNPEAIELTNFFEKVDKIKSEMRQIGTLASLSEIMLKVLDSIEKEEGVEFHFSLMDLNQYLGGLARGEMLVIGGFTSQAKSSLCLQIAMDMAEKGKRILFCSSEMSEFEAARRVLGNYCSIRIIDLRRGKRFEREKLKDLREVVDTLENWKFVVSMISDTSQVKKAVIEYKPDIVFVDHLHNLRGQGRNPYEKTTANIKDLKEIALMEKVAMIVACQLHRPQDDKLRPPRISDLRESGAIEETANSLILLYWKKQRENKEIDRLEEVEVRLVKNRDGRTGKFNVLFEPDYCRFRNLEIKHVANSE